MHIRVDGLTVRFGELAALSELSFTNENENVTTIIGPNGAGKTTLLNVLSGLQPVDSGSVLFDDDRVRTGAPEATWESGVSRTFQVPRLFRHLNVLDNVVIGVGRDSLRGFGPRRLRHAREAARGWLEIMGGLHLADRNALELGFPEQRFVELVRALASEPRLLMLDEPSAGVAVDDARALIELAIKHLKQDAAMLLVSHDVPLVFELAQRIIVLNFGSCIAQGGPAEIEQNPIVRKTYLGAEL